MQPGACISVCGPDVRWCGNEAGHTRAAEWSVVPKRTKDSELIAGKSQQEDSDEFRRRVDARDENLGSREALRSEQELIWYPAEVNTSIRPGWFWHESENDQVRSLEELTDIYMKSVGGNAAFLLNIPPTREGLIHENDLRRLEELGDFLRSAFAENILPGAQLSCDSAAEGFGIENAAADSYDSYFMADHPRAEITVRFGREERLGYLVLKENIRMSQRIESFCVDVLEGGGFREVYSGTVVGFKRIVPLGGIRTAGLRIRITDSRVAPTLSHIAAYRAKT